MRLTQFLLLASIIGLFYVSAYPWIAFVIGLAVCLAMVLLRHKSNQALMFSEMFYETRRKLREEQEQNQR